MSKKIKFTLLIIIITILALATVKQSLRLYESTKRVQIPTHQSRHLSEAGLYKWMTVVELSKKFNIKEEKVFELLGITPKIEDYKLSISKLKEKYNKTSDEILNGIKSIIEYADQNGGINE